MDESRLWVSGLRFNTNQTSEKTGESDAKKRSESRNGGGKETHSFRSEIKKRRSQEKNKYSNSFKDQAQLGSLFLRKGHSEEQRFFPFLLSTSKPDIHDSN